VGGFGYELLVIGLWIIITRREGNVWVGHVIAIQFRQGRRNILCLESGIKKKKDASPSELWFTILRLGLILQRGIFIIKVPFFDHRTQGLCFCYLPNIKSKWNKFKWENLDNSNYDNFHGGDDFSHEYVIMHKYFGKKPEM
jgi:hypothetical protein